MAIVFMDGFDNYVSNGSAIGTPLLRKWHQIDFSNPQPSAQPGRISGLCLYTGASNCYTLPFTSQATYIIGFAFKLTSYNFYGAIGVVKFMDSTSFQCSLMVDSVGHLYFTNGNNGTQLGSTGTTILALSTWYHIETKITINNTTGSFTVKLNGVTEISATSVNTRTTSNNTCNRFLLPGTRNYYDDFFILDTTGSANNDFIGDNKVETLLPNAAGNYSQWTPSSGANYTTVNETAVNDDTNYNSTATANNIDTYNFGNLVNVATGIRGICINEHVRKDNAGTKTIAPVIRISSTDYVGNTVSAIDSYYIALQIYEQNPNTTASWTNTDINNAEFGIKLIS